LDELYGFFIFEDELAEALSAAHPSQFLFNVRNPGLSDSVTLLNQMYVMLENYMEYDKDSDYYEEVK